MSTTPDVICAPCRAAGRTTLHERQAWHAARRVARMRLHIAWALLVVGVVLIAISVPVEGLPGAALALAGMALVWTAWREHRDGRR